MTSKITIKISVRDLISCVLRSGDLVTSFIGMARNYEGIRAHQKIQKSSPDEYTPEVHVSHILKRQDFILEVSGIIDGVIERSAKITIDEIKTTTINLEYITEKNYPLHWAQAKCYAFIYAKENDLNSIEVQLTYYHLESKQIKYLSKIFSIEELNFFFNDLADKYLKRERALINWNELRNKTIKHLKFPFNEYRKGQRKFAVGVYNTIKSEKKMFAQAPTGIGKTIATLFPALKAIGEGLTSKIFYLTAKTTTRAIAEKAIDAMREKGLKLKSITITAKDKICFNSDKDCEPDQCEFAKGYYDRVDNALENIFKYDSYTRSVIEKFAKKI